MKFYKKFFISLIGIFFAQAALADLPNYPFTSFYTGSNSCIQMLDLISNVCPGTRLAYNLSSDLYGQGTVYCKFDNDVNKWVQVTPLKVGDTGYFTCMASQAKK